LRAIARKRAPTINPDPPISRKPEGNYQAFTSETTTV
jgi:hypothetical protein